MGKFGKYQRYLFNIYCTLRKGVKGLLGRVFAFFPAQKMPVLSTKTYFLFQFK